MSRALAPSLVVEINAEHRLAEQAMQAGLEHARRAGELLNDAKAQIPHGGWIPWVEANCQFSERTAQLYMRIATRWPELEAKAQRVTDLSLRGAAALLTQSGDSGSVDPMPDSDDPLEMMQWCDREFARLPPHPEALLQELQAEASSLGVTITPLGCRWEKPSTEEEWSRFGLLLRALVVRAGDLCDLQQTFEDLKARKVRAATKLYQQLGPRGRAELDSPTLGYLALWVGGGR